MIWAFISIALCLSCSFDVLRRYGPDVNRRMEKLIKKRTLKTLEKSDGYTPRSQVQVGNEKKEGVVQKKPVIPSGGEQ